MTETTCGLCANFAWIHQERISDRGVLLSGCTLNMFMRIADPVSNRQRPSEALPTDTACHKFARLDLDGRKSQRTCPHCGKSAAPGPFSRWHGDACKHKRSSISSGNRPPADRRL